MGSSGVSASGARRTASVAGVARGDSPPVKPVDHASTVKSFLQQLFDAEKDGKTQSVQDLRNKLSELRENLGDEKFKEILKKLIEESDSKYLELLKRLLKEWFPDTDDVPPPNTPPPGGGGGGVGAAVEWTLRGLVLPSKWAIGLTQKGRIISTTSLITVTPGKSRELEKNRAISGRVSSKGLTAIV